MRHHLEATPATVHWGYFDAALPPVLTVSSGDVVVVGTVSGSPEYMPDDASRVPPALIEIHHRLRPDPGPHIVTGPIRVEGARPGDTLEVEVLDIALDTDWGWNATRPGLGALPDDFSEFRVTHLPIDPDRRVTTMPWGTELELSPFFGIMAVAPPASMGRVGSKPPGVFGGNMDNKELGIGSRVLFPVFNDGALFSAGDGHALQADGEVCLTALETCLTGTFRLTVRRGGGLRSPRAITPTHHITHGFDPDLDEAARRALRDMVGWLQELIGISAEEAYMLCSLACDLHITQLVDGNKGVHAMVANEVVVDIRE